MPDKPAYMWCSTENDSREADQKIEVGSDGFLYETLTCRTCGSGERIPHLIEVKEEEPCTS